VLTDKQCRAAKAGDDKSKLFDGHGLYLERLKSGAKSWRWKYRFDGKEKRLTFATYDRAGNVADFCLIVDGQDYSPRLISLSLTDKRGGEADQLDLVLDDSDGKMPLPARNASAALSLGWLSGAGVPLGLVDKGSFTIDVVDWAGPPDQVTIRARSADLTAGFRARRSAGHRATTLGAIARKVARKVARRHGYAAKVAPGLADVEVEILAQHQQSDMALLRRLGRQRDSIATVKNRQLILSPIGKLHTTSGAAFPALTLTRADVGGGYRYSLTERSADAGVSADYEDLDTGKRRTVTVGGTAKAGEKKDPRKLRPVFHSKADATAAADAAHRRAARSEVTMDLQLPLGRPDIYPDRPVTLVGFKREVDAHAWLIAEAAHMLDSQGLRTKLKLETR
jgi:phage protein D